jgi:thymidylate synthase (FAD)
MQIIRLAPTRTELLDHGYLEVIETWGSDQAIIEGARMSTQKGFLGWGTPEEPGDEKLLRYLYSNQHSTPFEMAGMTIEVQAPIMVFREWHRHRVPFGYSEASARYSPLPNMNYLPTLERCLVQQKGNKQAGSIEGAQELTDSSAQSWLYDLEEFYKDAEYLYQDGLARGIPKELARLCLPVGRYSKMRATGNLRGWLGFCTLRAHSRAQYEIRVYAEQVVKEIALSFPKTAELFLEYKRGP